MSGYAWVRNLACFTQDIVKEKTLRVVQREPLYETPAEQDILTGVTAPLCFVDKMQTKHGRPWVQGDSIFKNSL